MLSVLVSFVIDGQLGYLPSVRWLFINCDCGFTKWSGTRFFRLKGLCRERVRRRKIFRSRIFFIFFSIGNSSMMKLLAEWGLPAPGRIGWEPREWLNLDDSRRARMTSIIDRTRSPWRPIRWLARRRRIEIIEEPWARWSIATTTTTRRKERMNDDRREKKKTRLRAVRVMKKSEWSKVSMDELVHTAC